MADQSLPQTLRGQAGRAGMLARSASDRAPASAMSDRLSATPSVGFAQLLAAGIECGFRPNSILVHPKSPSTDVLVVVSGVLCMNVVPAGGRRQVTALIRAGDLVGIDGEPTADVSIEAATMGRVCRIPRQQFDELVRTNADVHALVQDAAAARLVGTRAHMELLRCRSADERVFGLLFQLSGCGLRNGEASDLVWWPMSYVDMADYLSLSEETVCRSLSRLRRQGLVAQERRHWFRLLGKIDSSAASSMTDINRKRADKHAV